jgi:histone acetyltransferase (RNA polymerase elongator complex component)
VQVVDWLQRTLPVRGNGEIAFYGGTFTLLPVALQQAYLAAAAACVEQGRVAGIRISTRPDALDREQLARLASAGVTTIEIGCQSFDDAVLRHAVRGHTAAHCVEALRRCRGHAFRVGAQLMPGLPGGSVSEALASLEQALTQSPDFVRIYPTLVIAGTALAAAYREGVYRPWPLDEMVELCADMLLRCRRADVPVIRLGLQADSALEQDVLAGPYHPAFGQLVRSRLWRRVLAEAASVDGRLCVNPVDLADAIGHRGENRAWLQQRHAGLQLAADVTVASGLPWRTLLDSLQSGGRHA